MEPQRNRGARERAEPSSTATRFAIVATIAVGLWLFWPSLKSGFHLDDYLHVSAVQHADVLPELGPFSLFTFAEPTPDRMGPIQGDFTPWWTAPDLRIDFQRPLTSLTYRVDSRLHGDDAVGYHATNLLLWAGLLCAVVVLFAELARRTGRGLPTLLLAGLVFALDRAHEENVAWIAGRYSLISVLFGVLALSAYHRWRSRGARAQLCWTLLWLVLGLAAGETAFGLGGFFIAYELSLGAGSWRSRLLALAPIGGVLILYLVEYTATGHGVTSPGLYLDPFHDFVRYVRQGWGERLPELLGELVLPEALKPKRLLLLVGDNIRPKSAALFLGLARALPFLVLSVLALHARRHRASRFLLFGSLLSLLPMVSGPVTPRSLLLPSIGFAWLYASLFTSCVSTAASLGIRWRPRFSSPWTLLRCALALALVWAHLRWEGPLAREALRSRANTSAIHLEHAVTAPIPTGAEAARARVLLLTSPRPVESIYLPILRLHRGLGWPAAIWPISPARGEHRITRSAIHSLRIEVDPPGLLASSWASLFRGDRTLVAGSQLRRGALNVFVEEVSARGEILAIRAEIDRPLDHPDVWLLLWEHGGWRRIRAPAVGGVWTTTPRDLAAEPR